MTHSGPLTDPQKLLAAASWGGSGAAVAGLTAARSQGLRGFDDWTDAIHLLLPAARTARDTAPPVSVAVHYSRHLTSADIHPARQLPQTRIARSLIDAAAWTRTDRGAQAVLAAGVQQRLVIVPKLAAEVERNKRLNRRRLIIQALGDIAGGAHALSELDFTRLVVRQFNLPDPDRQVPRRDENGRRRWLDTCWEKARLIVEIDGTAHLDASTYWDDMDRANGLTLGRYRVLRFPAWVVRSRPEYVAAKIRQALREAGYPG